MGHLLVAYQARSQQWTLEDFLVTTPRYRAYRTVSSHGGCIPVSESRAERRDDDIRRRVIVRSRVRMEAKMRVNVRVRSVSVIYVM